MEAVLERSGISSSQKQGTLQWLAEEWKPKALEPDLDSPAALSKENAFSLSSAWRDGTGRRWLPCESADLINPHSFGECGTLAYVCPELFNALGARIEDAKRLLDTHGDSKSWQQWKILNFVRALVIVSSAAYSLALSRWTDRSQCFPLGSFLPRSVSSPFTGDEGASERHIIQDGVLPKKYYASHQTTYSFIRSSERMDRESRWSNGNFIADYLRIGEKVPNVPEEAWMKSSGTGDAWKLVKVWRSVPNLYCATERMAELVADARADRLHFIPVDCQKISEWFHREYVDGSTGSLRRGKRVNARQSFRSAWRLWTGVRPAGSVSMPEEKVKNFPQAMKLHGREIAEGSLVYVTHIEKIVRGLFIGSSEGLVLSRLMEDRTPAALRKRFEARKRPNERMPSTDVYIESTVLFDRDFLFRFLESDERAASLDAGQLRQLARMAEEGWTDEDGNGMYRTAYRRSLHGRFCCVGGTAQMLPKWLRKELFGRYYVEADLGSAIVSIVVNEAVQGGYSGDLSELGEMLDSKERYRFSLTDEEGGIGYDEVKRMTTMISYGCRLNPKRMLTEAEWAAIQEAYCVEETMHDVFASRSRSALMADLNTPAEKMAVARWASSDRVLGFCRQMHDAGMFVIGQNTFRTDGKSVIRNAWGTELVLSKGTRLSFGKKLAHIYQGAESKLLWSLWDGLKVDGVRIRDIEGGFGLLVHDGFGIRRDIAERFGDLAKVLHDFAEERFGWQLKYSCGR